MGYTGCFDKAGFIPCFQAVQGPTEVRVQKVETSILPFRV